MTALNIIGSVFAVALYAAIFGYLLYTMCKWIKTNNYREFRDCKEHEKNTCVS